MTELHGRLAAVQRLCGSGGTVIDVGCDHGYLPLSLLEKGHFLRAVLTDVNEKPLESARRNFADSAMADRAEFVLGDGLCGVRAEGEYVICVCGMGGELISRILEEGFETAKGAKRLVLQPMSRPEALRRYLARSGFEILGETAVSEEDKLYLIFEAVFCGEKREISEIDALLGTKAPEGEREAYFKRLLDAYTVIKNGKRSAGHDVSAEEIIIDEIMRRTSRE